MSSSQCEDNTTKKGQESLKEIGRWRRLLEACLLDDPVLHLKIQKSEKDIICYTHNRGAEVPSLPVSYGHTEWVCRPWFFSNIWKVVLIKKGEVRHPKRRYKRSNDKLKNMEGGKGKKGSMKQAPHRHPSCLYWHYVQKPLFQALTDRINQPTVLMSHLTVPPTMPRNSPWHGNQHEHPHGTSPLLWVSWGHRHITQLYLVYDLTPAICEVQADGDIIHVGRRRVLMLISKPHQQELLTAHRETSCFLQSQGTASPWTLEFRSQLWNV